MLRLPDRLVITRDRVFKFARNACEYKLTHLMFVHELYGADATAAKDDIAHITKLFRAH